MTPITTPGATPELLVRVLTAKRYRLEALAASIAIRSKATRSSQMKGSCAIDCKMTDHPSDLALPSPVETALGLLLDCLHTHKMPIEEAISATSVQLAGLYPELTPLQVKLVCERAAESLDAECTKQRVIP